MTGKDVSGAVEVVSVVGKALIVTWEALTLVVEAAVSVA